MNLGFLGTGAITSAIVTGLTSAGGGPRPILLSPRNPGIAEDLANRFPAVSVAASNQDVLDRCETVVLAVRPQVARSALSELRFQPDHHVISLISTFSLGRISELVAPATRVARAVPLPSAARRRSPTAIYPRDPVAAGLFSSLGIVLEADSEAEFDAFCTATATIAPYFTFADSIASWLTRQGVPKDKARDYIVRIFSDLSDTAAEAPGRSLQSLADNHATAGGINEQLLAHLVQHGVFESVAEGLDAVLKRFTMA